MEYSAHSLLYHVALNIFHMITRLLKTNPNQIQGFRIVTAQENTKGV